MVQGFIRHPLFKTVVLFRELICGYSKATRSIILSRLRTNTALDQRG